MYRGNIIALYLAASDAAQSGDVITINPLWASFFLLASSVLTLAGSLIVGYLKDRATARTWNRDTVVQTLELQVENAQVQLENARLEEREAKTYAKEAERKAKEAEEEHDKLRSAAHSERTVWRVERAELERRVGDLEHDMILFKRFAERCFRTCGHADNCTLQDWVKPSTEE